MFPPLQVVVPCVTSALPPPSHKYVSAPQHISLPLINLEIKVNLQHTLPSDTTPLNLLHLLLAEFDKHTSFFLPITLKHPLTPPSPVILICYTYHQIPPKMAQNPNSELRLTLPSSTTTR